MTRNRGVTLLELMIAITITIVAIAATMGLVGYTGVLARHADVVAEGNNNARLAGELVASVLRNAGMGAGQGIYLGFSGSPMLVNAVYGADNLAVNYAGRAVNSSDDLWIIAPDKNAMRDSCNSRGAYVSVIAAGLGPLSVVPFPGPPCAIPFVNGDALLVTNMNKSVLATNIAINSPAPNQINYNESTIPGFSNAPERGGFQVGDMALRAQVVHFYLDINPLTNRLALYRANGLTGADFLVRPLNDIASTRTVVQDYIEDFQVVYWVDPNLSNDPSQYVIQHGMPPAYRAGVRSVTISVVATTARRLIDENNQVTLSSATAPKSVANHTVVATPDGYMRGIYTRRIEVPNLMSSNI
jgi:hypothetical protein